MSILYLAGDPRSLADQLADELDRHAKSGDFFTPVRMVTPNRYLQKWLRLHLARKLGIAINLDFQNLEDALWQLLREADPNQKTAAPEPIDENIYRLMVLSALLDEKDPHLASLERYLQREGAALSRLSCRRAWLLADRFGLLIRDYEYARQDALIQRWLERGFGLSSAGAFAQMMERAQRALFLAITREPDGKRALLNRLSERTYKTFPQYAMERMIASDRPVRSDGGVHFFGFTQISALHARTIAWLGRCFDVRFYHLNVLASRLDDPVNADSLRALAQEFREGVAGKADDVGRDLLHRWGRAGAEALELLTPLVAGGAFDVQRLPAPKQSAKNAVTVLTHLRAQLLGGKPVKPRLPQDTSVQIVGCAGLVAEVETVQRSIIANLQEDPTLRQSDIVVLVSDMAKYRAALQAVFERPPKRVAYNLLDFNAAGASTFGQALIGMLDLALESFARARVFAVLLNPCFLARLGVERTQAMTWLDWAESLGIYHGWDADEKAQQGYAPSPLYSWRLGLQRLRLGRYMDVTSDDADGVAARFGDVIPFADLDSGDRDHLDAFCRAVEGLLPTLTRLRTSHFSGERWANLLRRLVQEFLDVPEDRPEEAQVRTALLDAIEKLGLWDALNDGTQKTRGVPLALVREYVQSQLVSLPGKRGDYLVGGVTIAELQPMRPVPFALVYVLGLGEDVFPGGNSLSSFDLRGAQRLPGDIRPAEARAYDLLATVLSADKKLYLFYNHHDMHRDQALLPSVPLLQLARHLSAHIVNGEFQTIAMPTHAEDVRYLDPAAQPPYQDVLVQPESAERCLAILAARTDHRLALTEAQEAEWSRQWQALRRDFTIAPTPPEPTAIATKVSVTELRRFLYLPGQESLRRHLHVGEEDEQTLEDDEPLVTSRLAAGLLVRQTLQQVVLAAAQTGVDNALSTWQDRFKQTYADACLRSRAPEQAFGEIDCAALLRDLQERIHGQGQIETFLRERAAGAFCGPVLLGESMTPLGAKLRFPALRLRGELDGHEITLAGWTQLAWQTSNRFEILVLTDSDKIEGDRIHRAMIEPALLHLALLANTEPNADGLSSQTWMAPREFLLHVAHRAGIVTWSYPPGSITPDEAAAYLKQLTRDFLQPDSFDLLPFELLRERIDLRQAYSEPVAMQIPAEVYRAALTDAIEELRENSFSFIKLPLLVEMIHAEVPLDALAKVQRRFRLLDRGPARYRQQPRLSKGKRAVKP